mgnify:CR=1 FL=1
MYFNSRMLKVPFIVWLLILLSACGDKPTQLTALKSNSVILAYGDSLTFGYGANSKTESYPAILSQLSGIEVVNKGISGETSQQGLERLPSVLAEVNPSLVILCHGGNDLIRKLSQQQLKSNLDQMIQLIQNTGAEVMLIGVPNFSLMLSIPDLYSQLSELQNVPIQLDILQKIERDRRLKSDQVHPNAAGYKLMAETIHQELVDLGALIK